MDVTVFIFKDYSLPDSSSISDKNIKYSILSVFDPYQVASYFKTSTKCLHLASYAIKDLELAHTRGFDQGCPKEGARNPYL